MSGFPAHMVRRCTSSDAVSPQAMTNRNHRKFAGVAMLGVATPDILVQLKSRLQSMETAMTQNDQLPEFAAIKFRRSRNGGVYVYKLREKLPYLIWERQDRRPRDCGDPFLVAPTRDANGSLHPREWIAHNQASLATAIRMTPQALAHAACERRPLQVHNFRTLCKLFALQGSLMALFANGEPEDFITACRAQDGDCSAAV